MAPSNDGIEALLQAQMLRAQALLVQHNALLVAMTGLLLREGLISPGALCRHAGWTQPNFRVITLKSSGLARLFVRRLPQRRRRFLWRGCRLVIRGSATAGAGSIGAFASQLPHRKALLLQQASFASTLFPIASV